MRTGAQCTIDALVDAGVTTVFGLPGGTVLDLLPGFITHLSNSSWSGTNKAPRTWPMAMPAPQAARAAAS